MRKSGWFIVMAMALWIGFLVLVAATAPKPGPVVSAAPAPVAGPTITNPITNASFAQPLDLRSPVRGYIGPDSCAHTFVAGAWEADSVAPGQPVAAVVRSGGVADTVRTVGHTIRRVCFVTDIGELYVLTLRAGAAPVHLGSVWQLPAAKRRHHARR